MKNSSLPYLILSTMIIFFGLTACDDSHSGKKSETNKKLLDTKAPTIRLNGEASLTLLKNTPYIERKASARDNMDGYVKVYIEGTVDTTEVGTYRIKYTAKDSAGNSAIVSREVKIIAFLPDLIKLNGKSEIWIGQHTAYKELGVTETRYVDGELDLTIEDDIDMTTLGDYMVNYRATGLKKNKTILQRLIHVVDKTPPKIHLLGSGIVRIVYKSEYKEKGATAKDDIDGNLPVTITGKVNTSKIGKYKIRYSAKDKSGNSATRIREIEVLDATPPYLKLHGKHQITLSQGESYKEAGAEATDEIDGKVEVLRSGKIDTQKVGDYEFIYSAVDRARNRISVTRKVKVIALPKISSIKVNETNLTK